MEEGEAAEVGALCSSFDRLLFLSPFYTLPLRSQSCGFLLRSSRNALSFEFHVIVSGRRLRAPLK